MNFSSQGLNVISEILIYTKPVNNELSLDLQLIITVGFKPNILIVSKSTD